MPLKIFTIADPTHGEEAWSNWIRQNLGIKVISKHLCAHGQPEALRGHQDFTSFDRLYVFYEDSAEAQYGRDRDAIEQNAQLEMCLDIAKAMVIGGEHETYKKLSNTDQRRIYMLDQHNIPREDADKVHEILQMMHRGILPMPERRKP